MKKNLLSVVLLPSIALMLTACGGGKDEPTVFNSDTPQVNPAAATPSLSASTNTALAQQLDKAQSELNEVNERLKTLSADLEKVNQANTSSAATNASQSKPAGVDAASGANDTLKQKNDELTAEIAKINTAKKELEAKVDTLTKAKEEAEKQKSSLEKQVTEKTTAAEQANKLLDDLKKDKQTLEEQIKQAQAQNQTDTKTLTDLQNQLKEKEAQLTQASKNLTDKQTELNEVKKALEELQAKQTPPNNGGSENLPPKAPNPPVDKSNIISLNDALSSLKTNYTNPERGEYTGFIVTVDNTGKTATTQVIEPIAAGDPSAYFKVNGVSITLLGDSEDNIALRELSAEDFPESGAGTGFVGSKHGVGPWYGFQAMRFGVYNDANNKSHLFVYGNPAQTDRAKNLSHKTFYGSAVIGKDGKYQKLEKSVRADIGQNDTKVNIIIKAPEETLKFSGDIVADSKGFKTTFGGELDGNKVQGGFFGGNNILDMGGIFEVNKEGSLYQGQHGVFGASSDSDLYRKHDYKIEQE